jgi:hypothetical protein
LKKISRLGCDPFTFFSDSKENRMKKKEPKERGRERNGERNMIGLDVWGFAGV